MSNTQSAESSGTAPRLERSGIRRVFQVVVGLILTTVVLLVSAGRTDWPMAWVYIAIQGTAILINGLTIARQNPDLINERGRRAANIKGWDKTWAAIYTPMPLVVVGIAGLDAGRFGWSSMPFAVQIVGLVPYVLAFITVWWAMASNPFLSTMVRIQDDRGHQVITSGPYQHVRHPMYVGAILMWIGAPLALGSWWALIPGGLTVMLVIIRTALEDRTLQDELPGYAEYAQRVCYRLLPGVW